MSSTAMVLERFSPSLLWPRSSPLRVQACVVTKGNPNQRGVLAVDGGRTNGVERNMYALRLEASSSRLKASDLRGL